jgi:putative tricarboxylic transport membrane protein
VSAPAARGALALAAGVTALGLALLAGGVLVQGEAAYAGVGPRAFPLFVGAGLTLLGAVLMVALLRGAVLEPERGEDVDASAPADHGAIAWIVAGLLLAVATLQPLGFPVAAALVFAAGARAFGSRRWIGNLAAGLVLGAVTWLLFARGLGVSLPGGLLDRIG